MRVSYSGNYFTQKRLKKPSEVQGPKCMPHFSDADLYPVLEQLIRSFEQLYVSFVTFLSEVYGVPN